jgi:hypothetical protein
MRKTRTFECADCEGRFPLTRLSDASLRQSGSLTRLVAFFALPADQLVCDACADEWVEMDGDEYYLDGAYVGRTDRERFEFSGIMISPERMSAYRQSY